MAEGERDNGDGKIIPIYIEALKMVAAGNGAGLFGAGVALYYFANRDPGTLWWIKVTAVSYLLGVCAYSIAAFLFLGTAASFHSGGPRLSENTQTSVATIFGLFSFVVWWAGTIAAGVVLYRL